ncbi:hypothetical protein ERD78_18820 [Allopusillimonas soli]|uniref:GpW protein n=1 Tax=Allopusillimonas soli TaxID=659016 RepID=A0A853FG79_9BURK|nr:hypothetical protein [Allopusillimonas soli]NYT38879.1 hypothetical protein [Allopusillimonas soli]TEA70122.1 hypothetical protein ERD78_18820 [Allopusillimonas soli]
MAYTQADLDAIKAAIAGSELEVQYGDKRVRFRSMQDLKDAARLIQGDLDAQAGKRRSRIVRLRHGGKGI